MSARHTPRFQVVCYVAQEDGELAGDVLEIEAECSLQHKVSRRGLALEDVGGACCRGWGSWGCLCFTCAMFAIYQVAMALHRDSDMAIVNEENSVVPMTKVYVNVTSTPNTPVLVSMFDKSLSLLAGSCDIGKKSSVSFSSY